MRRLPLIAILIFFISTTVSCKKNSIDLDAYAKNLIDRNTNMLKAADSDREKDKLKFSGEMLIALQLRYDHQAVGYDEAYSLFADFDSKSAHNSLSDQDFSAFLQKGKPAFVAPCDACYVKPSN